mgnify:CR=1 FL=1
MYWLLLTITLVHIYTFALTKYNIPPSLITLYSLYILYGNKQKYREDQLRSQINRRLKQKMEEFKKLYRDHKQLEMEHKKLGADYD